MKPKKEGKNERATAKLSHRQNGMVTLENGQFLKKLNFSPPWEPTIRFWVFILEK